MSVAAKLQIKATATRIRRVNASADFSLDAETTSGSEAEAILGFVASGTSWSATRWKPSSTHRTTACPGSHT